MISISPIVTITGWGVHLKNTPQGFGSIRAQGDVGACARRVEF